MHICLLLTTGIYSIPTPERVRARRATFLVKVKSNRGEPSNEADTLVEEGPQTRAQKHAPAKRAGDRFGIPKPSPKGGGHVPFPGSG
ncbi:MAG: hypothetical protein ACK55Z_33270, partial [bacterium]